MGATFRTSGVRHELHLNYWNARPLLDVLGIDHLRGVNGEIPIKHIIRKADHHLKQHPVEGGRGPIDWSKDPQVGDLEESVRRLRSLANRSKGMVVLYG